MRKSPFFFLFSACCHMLCFFRVRSRSDTDSLDRIDGIGAPSEKWWTVEYSRKYRGVTMGFMQSVASGGESELSSPRFSLVLLLWRLRLSVDPENFWRILSKLPYHADTLLQLAEAYRYREGNITSYCSFDSHLC